MKEKMLPIGTVVRIRKDLNDNSRYYMKNGKVSNVAVGTMITEGAGKIARITRYNPTGTQYILDVNEQLRENFYWTDAMFEKVNEE